MRLEQIQEAIPQPVQHALNWAAAVTGLASFLTTWVPILVGVLSGIWIGLQIYLAVKKEWFSKKEKP